jgi:hypothetical protein
MSPIDPLVEAIAQRVVELLRPTTPVAPKLIHVSPEALAQYGLGPTVVRAAIEAGELPATVGSRRRLHVEESALITWRDARPIPIRAAKKREITGINEDPIDAMIRNGELRSVKGGKR